MAQALELEKKRLAERRRQKSQAEELAAQGRGGDTEIAHVTLGEIVLPDALQTPAVLDAIRQAAMDAHIPLEQLRVGSALNSINPETGQPEFFEPSQEFARDFPGASGQLRGYDFTQGPIGTEGLYNGPISIGRQPTNPDYVNAFFNTHDKAIVDLATEMNISPNLLLGLAAGESNWGRPQGKNNLFGISVRERPLDYPTPEAGMDAFRKSQWYSRLQNKGDPNAFVNELLSTENGKKKYNSKNPEYDKFIQGLIETIDRRRPIWERSR